MLFDYINENHNQCAHLFLLWIFLNFYAFSFMKANYPLLLDTSEGKQSILFVFSNVYNLFPIFFNMSDICVCKTFLFTLETLYAVPAIIIRTKELKKLTLGNFLSTAIIYYLTIITVSNE